MLINDASITGSLIVNASASFQNISVGGNIIPDTTNIRNLGSTDKYFKEIYVSTGSINFVDGGSVVAVLSAGTITAIQSNTSSANSRLNSIESVSASLQSFTASISTTNTFTSSATARLNALETTSASIDTLNSTQNNRLGSLETISASNISRISALETTSASVDTLNTTQNSRLNALETTSASVDTLNTTQNSRLTSLEIKTGSLATTGSNTFIGTQTITGSLYISSDLVVQGSSSLQNITASAVSIGTNIINLNTANPAIRYAGLSIGDSGSIGSSGSFLYDSVQDEMIFIHRGANTTVTSSVVLMGPQTFDNIGSETYPTSNYIQKGTGNEHLVDSCIIDNGTTVCVNTTLKANGQVCGVMGNFSCFGIGTMTPVGKLDVTLVNTRRFIVTYDDSIITIKGASDIGAGENLRVIGDNLIFNTNSVGSGTERMRITSTGISCFACQVCAPNLLISNCATIGTVGFSYPEFRLAVTPIMTVVGAGCTPTSEGIYFKRTSDLCQGGWISGNGGALYIVGQNKHSTAFGNIYFASNNGTTTCDIMVIDGVNQRVGIGTTTPYAKFEVLGGNQCPPSTGTQNYTMALRDPTSMVCGVGGSILFQGYKTGTAAIGNFAYIAGKKENGTAGNEAGYLSIGAFDSAGNISESMRVSSAGNLGIGFTTVSNKLQVAGEISTHAGTNTSYYAYMNYLGTTYNFGSGETSDNVDFKIAGGGTFTSGGNFRWFTQAGAATPTERMRICSNGKVTIVAPTHMQFTIKSSSSGDAKFEMGAEDGVIIGMNMYTAANDISWFTGRHRPGTAGITDEMNVYRNVTNLHRIQNNGNYSFAGSNVSDMRLKENIQIINYNATEKLLQLVPKSYNMIEHPTISKSGFIAQEVKEVLPNFVTGNESENEYLGLDYNGILALTVKAMQEQQCTINTLKSCLGIS